MKDATMEQNHAITFGKMELTYKKEQENANSIDS